MGMKVIIPQNITDAGKDYLRERGYEVEVLKSSSVESICEAVKDADGILIRTALLPRAVFEAGKKLKVIGRHGVGVDNIDLEAATEFGVQVTNAPISNFKPVAQHAMGMILACALRVTYFDKCARDGRWEERNAAIPRPMELEGKVLGLVGLGKIGRLVAQKAIDGFGMKVIGYDAFIKKEDMPAGVEAVDSLEEIFKQSDFVSLHMPATAETRNSIDEKYFKLMKPTAYFINCARGEIVNEGDLYKALKENWIAGAGVDVIANEPPAADDPLLTLENIIITPHTAALTPETVDRMGVHAAMGIDDVLSGKKPEWPVNKLK